MHLKFLSSTNIGQIWKSCYFIPENYSLHDYCLGDSELLGREDFKQGHDRPDEILQDQWGKGTPFM